MEYALYWLRHTPPAPRPSVVVVGDSRIAEGFSTRAAHQGSGGALDFISFGMPGATPRVWYYTLRDADPARNRFAAIAIAMDRYSDHDYGEIPANRTLDLNFLAGRLHLSDCAEFARSFASPELRHPVLAGCIFRGTVLRADILAFLADIPTRRAHAKDWRDKGLGYISGYEGKSEDLTGLTADIPARAIHYPPGLKPWQTQTIPFTLLPGEGPQTGSLTVYRHRWLGAILDLYKDSPTRIFFFEQPRAPLPVPDPPTPPRFLEAAARRPRVVILPETAFREFERPELFADGLHLNHAGRPLFSARLGQLLRESILPPSGR